MTRTQRLSCLALLACLGTPALAQEANQPPALTQQPLFGTIAVRLKPDGTLSGTVGYINPATLELVPIPDVEMTFVQNRRVMAFAKSSGDGSIVVRGLSAQAVYTVQGRANYDGQRWFSAIGVAVLAPNAGPGVDVEQVAGNVGTTRLASLTAKSKATLALEQIAQPQIGIAMVPMTDVINDDDDGGFVIFDTGGAVGGGGGLGGAAGGLGPAAILAAGIAAAAAIANDDNVTSPFFN